MKNDSIRQTKRSELFDKTDDYTEWCRSIDANTKEETVNPNWVITDTFFAVDDDRIVGIIDFRHTLNDFLKDLGHCGYSVRPSERRKGFATEMPLLISSIGKHCDSFHLSIIQRLPEMKRKFGSRRKSGTLQISRNPV